MPSLLGCFVFLALGDGVLASKFGNICNPVLLSESAMLLEQMSDPFLGVFATIWLDDILHQGERMVVDERMMGVYWNHSIQSAFL